MHVEEFLNNLDEEKIEFYEDILDEVEENFPTAISHRVVRYFQLMENEEYLHASMIMRDFFEITMSYVSTVLIHEIDENLLGSHETFKNVLEKLISKPLSTGDWINDIFIVLVKVSKELAIDTPLINSIHEKMMKKSGNLLEGWKYKSDNPYEYAGFAKIRNDYFGHETTLNKAELQKILTILEPRMLDFLDAILPIGEYTAFSVEKEIPKKEGEELNTYTINILKHDNSKCKIYSDMELQKEHFYSIKGGVKKRATLQKKNIISFTPMIVYMPVDRQNLEQNWCTFLFQTLHSKDLGKMVYISPCEDAKKQQVSHFKDDMLEYLQCAIDMDKLENETFNIEGYKVKTNKEKSWNAYVDYADVETKTFLGQMKKEKYDPELFIVREELLNGFKMFMQDEQNRAFVLLGNAGSGKTNIVCYFTELLAKQEEKEDEESVVWDLVLTFYSKVFTDFSLEKRLKELFDEPKTKIEDLLFKINKQAQKENKTVLFVFDAINECLNYNVTKGAKLEYDGPVKLIQDIDRLLVHEKLTNIKVIITCRTYTWSEAIESQEHSLKRGLYFTTKDMQENVQEDKEIILSKFSYDEFERVYPKYQEKFQLLTTQEEMQEPRYRMTKERLLDPLILKTASKDYAKNVLPTDIVALDSISLFEAQLSQVQKSEFGKEQLKILHDFTKYLKEKRRDAIKIYQLMEAYEDEHDTMHKLAKRLLKSENGENSQQLSLLIDAGVLRIEHSTKYEELRFVYERFHEYMLARLFVDEESEKLKKETLPIPASAYIKDLHEAKDYVVMWGALRNALIIDYRRTKELLNTQRGDSSTIIALAGNEVFSIQSLVVDALKVLINENYADVYDLIEELLIVRNPRIKPDIKVMDKLEVQMEEEGDSDKAEILHNEYKAMADKIAPEINKCKVAVGAIYLVFKSEIYSKSLYSEEKNPFNLLWKSMKNEIAYVRDYVSLYIYYIAKYDQSIGQKILNTLNESILDTNLFKLVLNEKNEPLLEPAARLSLLLLVEAWLEGGKEDPFVQEIYTTWDKILKKLTLGHLLTRIAQPFIKIVLKRQGKVQTEYVNNGIEYQHFWDKDSQGKPYISDDKNAGWNKQTYSEIVAYLDGSKEGFGEYHESVYAGMMSADSFSFFLLERVLISQGVQDWESIKTLVQRVYNASENEYIDYIQMSLLYTLFHTMEKSEYIGDDIFNTYESYMLEWTRRCKGYFHAPYDKKANNSNKYKQYTLNWYGAIYCKKYGDGKCASDDKYSVPIFRELIEEAFYAEDKDLMFYAIENIAVLVSDFGYYKTALDLFEFILGLFTRESDIEKFAQGVSVSVEHYDVDLRVFLSTVLVTIKNYFPKELEKFINNDLAQTNFPEFEKFREELIRANEVHENFGDLITHKVGNFMVRGIVFDDDIRGFFISIFNESNRSKNYIEWIDKVIVHILRTIFNVKV
jgi:hypothetical protein